MAKGVPHAGAPFHCNHFIWWLRIVKHLPVVWDKKAILDCRPRALHHPKYNALYKVYYSSGSLWWLLSIPAPVWKLKRNKKVRLAIRNLGSIWIPQSTCSSSRLSARTESPFMIGNPKPNADSLEAFREAEEFFASGHKGRFANVEELFDDLDI